MSSRDTKNFVSLLNLETSLVAHMVKHLPTMRETWVQSLGWEDLLEKEIATHSSILACATLWAVACQVPLSMELHRVGHD